MNPIRKPFLLLAIAALTVLTGCDTVQTTGVISDSDLNIAYHLRRGSGPTIVFQSGLGDGKSVWSEVIAQLPEEYSLFAYDRPGYGDSPINSDSRSPCSIAIELHCVLKEANVPPPYILVGHSIGGLYQYSFATEYPNEVASLVLLDPTHPQHWRRMQVEASNQANLIKGMRNILFSKAMKREFDDQEECLNLPSSQITANAHAAFLFSGQFKIEERGAFETLVRDLRSRWQQLFQITSEAEIANSGHYLQKDAPERVAQAIKQAIKSFHR